MKRLRFIILLVLTGLGFVLSAQDKAFTASAPAAVQSGQQFQYIISGNEQGDVTLPSMDKFDLLAGPFSSFSTQSQWANGRMVMNTVVTYTYIYRAREEGDFTIAPATIRAGRKSYETNDVHITVTKGATANSSTGGSQANTSTDTGSQSESDQSQSLFMRIIPSKTSVYLGEQLTSGLKIYTSVNTRPGEVPKEVAYEGFYKKMIDPDQSSSREDIDGKTYVTQVIQRHILVPQKTGDLTIQPYTMDWLVQKQVTRKRSGGFFDDPFFDDPFFRNSVQEVPQTLSTEALTIHVKPLPDGAPDGFTGAVGNFSMKAELSQDELNVNEALSLKITVTGSGNLNLLGNPLVSLPPDHDVYDVTRKLALDENSNRISGSVVFEYPIVVRHAGKYRIPPIKFSWFDPVSASYKSINSKEFTFTVVKGDNDEATTGQVFIPGVNGSRVDDLGTDIRDIIRTDPGLHKQGDLLLSRISYILFYPFTLLLFALAMILLKNRIRRNADIRMVKNRKAGKIARERLKQADKFRKAGDDERFYEETGKAIWLYLADKLLIDLSQLSRDAVLQKLVELGISNEKAGELLAILDACEYARFSPASEREDINKVFRDTLALIRTIEETI